METAPSFSVDRKLSVSLNVALSILSVVALLVMVNYLSARHFKRLALAEHSPVELSPLTQRMLNTLTNEVKIIIYFDKNHTLYRPVETLLREYKFANRRISVETVDRIVDTAAASFVQAKYKLNLQPEQKQNVVIFDSPGRPTRVVYDSELSDWDMKSLMSGKEVKRANFKGELLFTSAMAAIVNPRPIKAYFLQGHGEHRPEGEDGLGYSKLGSVLAENNVQLDYLTNLLGSAEVPADASVVVIAGPTDPLLGEELEKIDNYLKQGGRLLVLFRQALFNPGREYGLERMLANWGVAVGNNVVWDPPNASGRTRGDVQIRDMKVRYLDAQHALTRPLYHRSGLYMVLPRSVRKQPLGSTSAADAPQVSILATTSPEGQILADIRKDGTIQSNPSDVGGKIGLMAAVEKGRIRGVSADRGLVRMLVVGESVFLNNENITKEANQEFVTHAMNWLLARDELLAPLAPRPMKEYKFVISDSQRTTVGVVLMALMPGAVLVVGSLVWLRRRK